MSVKISEIYGRCSDISGFSLKRCSKEKLIEASREICDVLGLTFTNILHIDDRNLFVNIEDGRVVKIPFDGKNDTETKTLLYMQDLMNSDYINSIEIKIINPNNNNVAYIFPKLYKLPENYSFTTQDKNELTDRILKLRIFGIYMGILDKHSIMRDENGRIQIVDFDKTISHIEKDDPTPIFCQIYTKSDIEEFIEKYYK